MEKWHKLYYDSSDAGGDSTTEVAPETPSSPFKNSALKSLAEKHGWDKDPFAGLEVLYDQHLKDIQENQKERKTRQEAQDQLRKSGLEDVLNNPDLAPALRPQIEKLLNTSAESQRQAEKIRESLSVLAEHGMLDTDLVDLALQGPEMTRAALGFIKKVAGTSGSETETQAEIVERLVKERLGTASIGKDAGKKDEAQGEEKPKSVIEVLLGSPPRAKNWIDRQNAAAAKRLSK